MVLLIIVTWSCLNSSACDQVVRFTQCTELQVWPTRAPSAGGRVILSSRTQALSPGVRPPTNSDTGRREQADRRGGNILSGMATRKEVIFPL